MNKKVVNMELFNVKGWSIGSVKREVSVSGRLISKADVYYTNRKLGFYDDGKLFDALYTHLRIGDIPVDVSFNSYLSNTNLMALYRGSCLDYRKKLTEYFGEELSGNFTIANLLVKLDVFGITNKLSTYITEYQIILMYNRESSNVMDDSRVYYNIVGYELVGLEGFTKEYESKCREKGLYPVPLSVINN
jgi:hypothetical protein